MWRLVIAVFVIQALATENVFQNCERHENPEAELNVVLLGDRDFLPEHALNKVLATKVCNNKIISGICGKTFFIGTGFDLKSLKMLYHESQPILRAYDWGSPEENLAHHNQTIPPAYNLVTMKVPTALWSGLRDVLADPKDVSNLNSQIHKMIYHKILPTYDNLAFIFGVDAPQTIYNEIIKVMKETP